MSNRGKKRAGTEEVPNEEAPLRSASPGLDLSLAIGASGEAGQPPAKAGAASRDHDRKPGGADDDIDLLLDGSSAGASMEVDTLDADRALWAPSEERPPLQKIIGKRPQRPSPSRGGRFSGSGWRGAMAGRWNRAAALLAWASIAALLGGGYVLYSRNLRFTEQLTRLQGEILSIQAELSETAEAVAALPAAGSAEDETAMPGSAGAASTLSEFPAIDGGAAESAPVEPVEEAEVVKESFPGVENDAVERIQERVELMERRFRLTSYADEAISSGSRYAFKQLEKEFDDPSIIGLKIAANAEIIRVESVYVRTANNRFREIPLDQIDPTLQSDVELSVAQLGDLILSGGIPVEARARAAELLGNHRDFEACLYLLDCIRTDPNLAVLQQAVRSFERLTGYYSGRVFGDDSVGEWFDQNESRIRESLAAGQ